MGINKYFLVMLIWLASLVLTFIGFYLEPQLTSEIAVEGSRNVSFSFYLISLILNVVAGQGAISKKFNTLKISSKLLKNISLILSILIISCVLQAINFSLGVFYFYK